MNPITSLSMIYLREFERTNSTVRGQVRLARKAGHLLRMHWQWVAQRAAHGSEIAADGLKGSGTGNRTAETPKRLESAFRTGLVSDLRGAGGL